MQTPKYRKLKNIFCFSRHMEYIKKKNETEKIAHLSIFSLLQSPKFDIACIRIRHI